MPTPTNALIWTGYPGPRVAPPLPETTRVLVVNVLAAEIGPDRVTYRELTAVQIADLRDDQLLAELDHLAGCVACRTACTEPLHDHLDGCPRCDLDLGRVA